MADQWGGQQQPPDVPGGPGGSAPQWPAPADQAQVPPYAAGPWSGPGYGPANYVFVPVPQQRGSNGAAVAGFILAFVLAPLGFIFSIIGLVRADKVGGAGRGLAIAGLIISLLDAVTAAVLIVVLGVFSTAAVVASAAVSNAASSAGSNTGSGGNPSQTSIGAASSDPGCTTAESSFQSMLGTTQNDEKKLTTDAAGSDQSALQPDLAAFTKDVQGIKTALGSSLAQAQHYSVEEAIQTMDTDINTVLTGLQAIQSGDTSQLNGFEAAANRLGSDGDALDQVCAGL